MALDLTDDDIRAVLANDQTNPAAVRYPMYPLLSPGMPPAGPNFVAHARALGDAADVGFNVQKLYFHALYDKHFSMPVTVKGRREHAQFVIGHVWHWDAIGPVLLDDAALNGLPRVMVLGKLPGQEEIRERRNLVGPSGAQLRTTLETCGVPASEYGLWYVANLVRWPQLGTSNTLPQAWIKDCALLLQQELRLFRPDYILCLGAEACKAMCGSGNPLKSMIGRSVDYTFPLHEQGEPDEYHTAKAMAVVHPAAVVRTTELYPQFEQGIRNFVRMIRGESVSRAAHDEIELRMLYKVSDLRDLVSLILSKPGLKKIAVDGEWHGNHPGEPGAYLRTIQFSHHSRFGAVVVLREAGGAPVFKPSIDAAIAELRRLLDRDDVQLGGSFFSADLPWLQHAGLPLAHRFTVPATVNEVRGGMYPGGFDVALAHHAYNETGDFKLEVMASQYCGAPRWDVELGKWKKAYCAANKLKDEELDGYGNCPDAILLPYGGYDAAYTRQLMDVHCTLLNADKFGLDCWMPFFISMRAFLAFNEMSTVGIKVDPARIDLLTDLFQEVRAQTMCQLREAICWPEFNPRSSQQCIELLFGEAYSTRIDKETGRRISVRPPGALSLYLTPVKSTGAKGRPWSWVVGRGLTDKYTPSSDKETCGILGLQSPLALQLRDVRIIDQVLKSIFRPPKMTGNTFDLTADGRRVYGGGIAKYICRDSRVRSHFQQVKETGRASSARPPLQNISKRREGDYKRIMGSLYRSPIRSFIVSNTDPAYGERTVLVEADYKGAELMGMAVMARDATMLEHCLRANLPDNDPRYYDIHSNVAVAAFRLGCEPTQKGLKSIGQISKRVSSKNILFGISYGRTAEACARQCQEEGVVVTPFEAQQTIDTIFGMYPGIQQLQEKLRARAHDPCFLTNCFGRRRRCIPAEDMAAMGELERQFLNFPFQSMVADAMSNALHYLYWHPEKATLGYRIVLQLHDAVMLEVPLRSLDAVYDGVLDECMVQRVPFYSCDCDGNPYSDSPQYRFGIDKAVMTRWGVSLTPAECDALGISTRYARAG